MRQDHGRQRGPAETAPPTTRDGPWGPGCGTERSPAAGERRVGTVRSRSRPRVPHHGVRRLPMRAMRSRPSDHVRPHARCAYEPEADPGWTAAVVKLEATMAAEYLQFIHTQRHCVIAWGNAVAESPKGQGQPYPANALYAGHIRRLNVATRLRPYKGWRPRRDSDLVGVPRARAVEDSRSAKRRASHDRGDQGRFGQRGYPMG